jgi:hypothetical protein
VPRLVIEHAHEIEAPAERVWQVICDLDRYPEWNPFVVACRSSLAVGEPIEMRVRVLPWFSQSQREQVFVHLPGRRLCYGLPRRPLGALASRRCHELEPLSASRCRYLSRFELSGWLAPLVRALLGARLRTGFAAMSAALCARAEALGPAV